MDNPRLNIYLRTAALHRRIKIAAARAGTGLSDYCLEAIELRLAREVSAVLRGAQGSEVAEPVAQYGSAEGLPAELVAEIAVRARERGESTSVFLAGLLRRDAAADWPAEFFSEVVGGWRGAALERGPQGEFEARDEL